MHPQQLVQGRDQELILVVFADLPPIGETEQIHIGRERPRLQCGGRGAATGGTGGFRWSGQASPRREANGERWLPAGRLATRPRAAAPVG